jgi:hypothetical protein
MGCGAGDCGRWQTSAFDISAYIIDNPNGVSIFSYGSFLGQLWTAMDDWESDTEGKARFTALQKASVDSDPAKFVHVTWSVNIVGTHRRYPQLIISDQDAPVQEAFANASQTSLIVQTFEGPNAHLDAQAFHGLISGKPWAVNNQAPEHRFIDYGNTENTGQGPQEPPLEHSGMDRMVRFDAYLSKDRLYLYFDGTPAGCMLYPGGFALQGPVTLTFGDVLYHEGAGDEGVCSTDAYFAFLHAHSCSVTTRHWDDLGFKNGVSAPSDWDSARFPCRAY